MVLCSGPRQADRAFSPRGWGILAVKESSFVNVQTKEELFGLASGRIEILKIDKSGNDQFFVNVRQIIGQVLTPGERAPFRGELSYISHHDHPTLPNPVESQMHIEGQVFLGEESSDESGSEGNGQGDQGNGETSDDEETSDEGEYENIHEDDTDGSDEDDGHFGAPLHGLDMEIEGVAVVHLPPWPVEHENIPIAGFGSDEESDEGPDAASDDELDDQSDNAAAMVFIPAPLGMPTQDNQQSFADPVVQNMADDSGQYGNIYIPHNATTFRMHEDGRLDMEWLDRAPDYNTIIPEDGHPMDKYAQRLHLLRTYEKDIEMWGFGRPNLKEGQEVNVVCTDALRFGRLRDGLRFSQHFHATSRLNMIAHAPELGLVVIGSPTGRVLLVTLTRMIVPVERPEGKWSHGFRVERILPDEEVHRKISRPLHGMAMGPVQSEKGKAVFPRTYRLMLHFRSHDILSYEISREEETGVLCIF
jgi:hypothetical protein